jgi:hypothetical protein
LRRFFHFSVLLNMSNEPYFQFPLCALSFGKTEFERLNAILDYSLVTKGWILYRKLPVQKQNEFLATFRQSGKLPEGCNTSFWQHCAALYGSGIIGLTLGDFLAGIERYNRMREHIARFEKVHGTDSQVRIRRTWLFDARDGRGLTYREFAVLCAIYSVIGNKELANVTRERIRRCALGYHTAAIMGAELPRRTDKGQPLTERQLRDTIARLHRNKFFARCTVARRITYYSIRLDNEAFRKKILDRRTYPNFFHASQSAQDQALTAAIRRRRSEIAAPAIKTRPLAP